MSTGAHDAVTLGELQAQIDALKGQVARLTASMSAATGTGATGGKIGRRALMRRAAGATAAAALLLVAKEAATAEASSRTTVVGPSSFYGLAASPGGSDPQSGWLPFINQNYGVIGSVTTNPVFSERAAGVLGLTDFTTGVQGLARSGFGVFGSAASSGTGVFGGSSTGIGVYANSNGSTGLFATAPGQAVWGRTTSGLGVFGQATNFAGIGVYGVAPAFNNTWAGFFEGNVYITGQLIVNGRVLSPAQDAPAAATVTQERRVDLPAPALPTATSEQGQPAPPGPRPPSGR